MECKTIEIRDVGTSIPALAIKLNPGNEQDRYLLGRAGYGVQAEHQSQYVLLLKLSGGSGDFNCRTGEWTGGRTMQVAHQFIKRSFDELESGQVVDVEFILGETPSPKQSEHVEAPV